MKHEYIVITIKLSMANVIRLSQSQDTACMLYMIRHKAVSLIFKIHSSILNPYYVLITYPELLNLFLWSLFKGEQAALKCPRF